MKVLTSNFLVDFKTFIKDHHSYEARGGEKRLAEFLDEEQLTLFVKGYRHWEKTSQLTPAELRGSSNKRTIEVICSIYRETLSGPAWKRLSELKLALPLSHWGLEEYNFDFQIELAFIGPQELRPRKVVKVYLAGFQPAAYRSELEAFHHERLEEAKESAMEALQFFIDAGKLASKVSCVIADELENDDYAFESNSDDAFENDEIDENDEGSDREEGDCDGNTNQEAECQDEDEADDFDDEEVKELEEAEDADTIPDEVEKTADEEEEPEEDADPDLLCDEEEGEADLKIFRLSAIPLPERAVRAVRGAGSSLSCAGSRPRGATLNEGMSRTAVRKELSIWMRGQPGESFFDGEFSKAGFKIWVPPRSADQEIPKKTFSSGERKPRPTRVSRV